MSSRTVTCNIVIIKPEGREVQVEQVKLRDLESKKEAAKMINMHDNW